MREAAKQQAQPDDAVADDHHRRVDRVARQFRHLAAPGDHHRQDQRGLDDRDGEREHQRTEGLTNAMRDHLRVMNSGDHRGAKPDPAQRREPGANGTQRGCDR